MTDDNAIAKEVRTATDASHTELSVALWFHPDQYKELKGRARNLLPTAKPPTRWMRFKRWLKKVASFLHPFRRAYERGWDDCEESYDG